MARSALALALLAALAATALAAPEPASTGVATKVDSELSFPGLALLNDLLNNLQCGAKDANGIGAAILSAVSNTRSILAAVEGFKGNWQSCSSFDFICKLKVMESATSNMDTAQKDFIVTLQTFQGLLEAFDNCLTSASAATPKVKA